MLQHISFKDWNPIGKPSGKKTIHQVKLTTKN